MLRRSLAGAWIEIAVPAVRKARLTSRSLAGAWIEMPQSSLPRSHAGRRSLAGAWIEIACSDGVQQARCVAPLRERGLKSKAEPTSLNLR